MTHGGNIFEIQRNCNIDKNQLLDYSANINPLGVPQTFKKIMKESLEDIEHYPDIHYDALKTAIEKYYTIDKSHIYLGNGAAEIIFNTIRAIAPKKSILLAPTFSEYAKALNAVDSVIEEVHLKKEDEFSLDMEELIETIDTSTDLVVLCNPNNPTGTLIETKDIVKLLKKCHEKNTYLMIDEAFMDFIEEDKFYSMLHSYKLYPHLIIVRAFTKFYSIPGMRLGFGVCCNEGILKKIYKITPPWNLNTFASYFGKVLLTEEQYVKETYQWLKEEKSRFVTALEKIEGMKTFAPSVNFILIKILKPSMTVDELRDKLLKKGILIRDCSNFNGLDKSYFRIAIKDEASNDILIENLKIVMGK
ncbi:MAG: threonine-phosphate decarboxylase [Clostridiaceae bacterium]|nr:threonine-phosphate decarboxylase [Clostridiaceae bacterium]